MTRKQKRLSVILGLGVVAALATTLILTALRDQIVFFFSPTELAQRPELAGDAIRVGGLVQEGTLQVEGENARFAITDGETELLISFTGILPDLFREGQGVIAEGAQQANGEFAATNVLAKHDENYIPKEVAATLKEDGLWQGNESGGDT